MIEPIRGLIQDRIIDKFTVNYSNNLASQLKTCPVPSNHQPNAWNKLTFAVKNGRPNSNTPALPRKMITAENNQPCDVMSDCRVFKACHVKVT
jgi:hypothetical protein